MPSTAWPSSATAPGGGLHQAEHRAREGRLAAARLAHHAEDLAAPPLERDAVERARHAAPRAGTAPPGRAPPSARRAHRARPPRRRLDRAGHSRPRREVARRGLARAHLAQRRVREAALGGVGAARPEAAALRHLARIRRAARDRRRRARARRRSPAASRAGAWCTGCCGAVEHRAHRPGLDDPPRVHDRDPVAGLGQHAEVVRDQDQRQPELLAQVARAAASTCACMTTSSAVVGSSAITSDGRQASARAIIIRWRCPPESWCA